MTMIRSIAVTTDFSSLSRRPFDAAASLARRFGAKLHLVHVAQSPEAYMAWQVMGESPAEKEGRRAELQKRLDELAASDTAFAGLAVRTHALSGEDGEAIERFQRGEGIDLIVMASHGHTGIEHFLLGSFTARVLQLVSCPVLVFRSTPGTDETPKPFLPLRILVPHDFSEPSAAALEVAMAWTREFHGRARLLSVVEDFPAEYAARAGVAGELSKMGEKARAEAEERLRAIAEKEWRGLEVETAVRVGRPAQEVLEDARSWKPELIILASRGVSPLERLNIGSVADRVVHGATSPVLVVRRPPERAIAPPAG